MRARHFLQRGHQHEQPRALAVLDDAGHMKIVLQDVQRLPHLDLLGSRVHVVHQNVVRVLQLGARHARRIRPDTARNVSGWMP